MEQSESDRESLVSDSEVMKLFASEDEVDNSFSGFSSPAKSLNGKISKKSETYKSSKPEATIIKDGAVASTSIGKGPGENKKGKAPLKRKSETDISAKTSKKSKQSKRKQELSDFSDSMRSMFTELISNVLAALPFTSSQVAGEQNVPSTSTSADNISNSTEPVQMIFSDNESDNSEGSTHHNLDHSDQLGDIEFELPNIFEDSERYGEEVEASVSNIVETVIRKKADVASLVKKEDNKMPSNCKGLNPPTVNAEIWQNLDRKARSQDIMFQTVQRLMGLGIVPILRIAQMLRTKSFDQTICRELVSRAIAILCNAFFKMSVRRRMLQRPAIDRRFNQLINRSEPFDGKDFTESRRRQGTCTGKRAELYQKDSPDWAPSVNMSVTEIKEKQVHKLLSPEMSRFQRRQQRTEKTKECAAAKSLLNLQDTTAEEPEQETGEQS
ncbi:unnamed protein product [Mytilus coruscus]|uniref:Uncharacterized protein n=1 Tax=Mytilus coruscus TaxID=42192 RepID=A0A6J8CM00_MYTCO|nr:unnamed protein product [Mytilus coruscus]